MMGMSLVEPSSATRLLAAFMAALRWLATLSSAIGGGHARGCLRVLLTDSRHSRVADPALAARWHGTLGFNFLYTPYTQYGDKC